MTPQPYSHGNLGEQTIKEGVGKLKSHLFNVMKKKDNHVVSYRAPFISLMHPTRIKAIGCVIGVMELL